MKWTGRDVTLLRKLWLAGVRSQDIADRLGRSKEAVQKRASEFGYARRKLGKARVGRDEIVVPEWVPEPYHTSYCAIASAENEHKAAEFARNSLAIDRIMTRMGISP